MMDAQRNLDDRHQNTSIPTKTTTTASHLKTNMTVADLMLEPAALFGFAVKESAN